MDYQLTAAYDEEKREWKIKVSGEIDIFNSNAFKESLNTLIGEKQASLIIECSELKYIDSTALGSLVAVLKNVKAYGGEVKLENLRKSLTKLFKITNLDKAFVIEGDSYE